MNWTLFWGFLLLAFIAGRIYKAFELPINRWVFDGIVLGVAFAIWFGWQWYQRRKS